jgi:hypothetical protein
MAKTLDNTERRRIRRRKEGLCVACGIDANGRSYCETCRKRNREKGRRRQNCKPWQPGDSGRPPIGREVEAKRADIHKTIAALRDKLDMRRAQCLRLAEEIAEWRVKLRELAKTKPR